MLMTERLIGAVLLGLLWSVFTAYNVFFAVERIVDRLNAGNGAPPPD